VQLTEALCKEYDTEGVWISVPEDVTAVYRSLLQQYPDSGLILNNHFEGMCNALKNAAMMVTMTARDDIDAVVTNDALLVWQDLGGQVYLFLYDKYVGGLGYAEKIYEQMEQIVENAIRMVQKCPCQDGCPACVGDYKLDKQMVLWGLKSLLAKSEAPRQAKRFIKPPLPTVKKQFSFEKLAGQWDLFVACLKKNGEQNSAFFGVVQKAEVNGQVLDLWVNSPFYQKWASMPANEKSLQMLLRHYTDAAEEVRIRIQSPKAAESDTNVQQVTQRIRRKLQTSDADSDSR